MNNDKVEKKINVDLKLIKLLENFKEEEIKILNTWVQGRLVEKRNFKKEKSYE